MSSFTDLKSSIDSLAIGKFDGLHYAHMKIIEALDGQRGVLVIDNDDSVLTPRNYRETIVSIPFFYYNLEEIRGLEGREFVEKLKKEFTSLKKIVVGYDFMFGRDRSFCAWDLQEFFDGECVVIPEIKLDGISVHSGVIKELLRHGSIERANILLGRSYEICGNRIKGQGIGTKELYPTINVESKKFLLPAEGVYITKSEVCGKEYPSVSFLGHRVSTDRNFSIETHILTPFRECSDDRVIIRFIKKLRENRKFNNLKKLKSQIKRDIDDARQYFR